MNITIQNTEKEPATSPLGQLNAYFHQHYAARKHYYRQKIQQGDVLLIIRLDSRLVSCLGDDIKQYTINDQRYHQLKALAHSTLAAYYSLLHSPLTAAVPLVRNWLPQLRATPAPEQADAIASATGQLLDDIEQTGTVNHLHIQQYAKKLEPVFARLLRQSAEDEVTTLYRYLATITEQSGKAASDTFFIVFGGAQARSRELAKLVFTNWCNESDDILATSQHHVRYSEAGSTVDDAVELIATVMADRELAQTFLGRAEGLEQDVLGKAAEKAIARFHANPDAAY
ncbi:hypothetical protein [Arsukibacterium sp.]|uniref:hypothetical protein n=1 Tax=Arsukibacterium sp. TaxID=1977258 RepID=UPI00299D3638|nr:hypothetical protein [Arsukibacterium sp.]MDX1677220.1 hypothetical protein [Arsukibacterium sp.]